MTADIFTLCDYAQESDGKLTVVGAFDTIYARRFPAVHPSMCLALRLRFYIHEEGKHAMRITFTGPDGEEPVKAIDGEAAVKDFEGPINVTLTVDGRELLTSPLYAKKA
jgi:hypothetical protein